MDTWTASTLLVDFYFLGIPTDSEEYTRQREAGAHRWREIRRRSWIKSRQPFQDYRRVARGPILLFIQCNNVVRGGDGNPGSERCWWPSRKKLFSILSPRNKKRHKQSERKLPTGTLNQVVTSVVWDIHREKTFINEDQCTANSKIMMQSKNNCSK